MANSKAEKFATVRGENGSKINQLIQLANEITSESILNLDLQEMVATKKAVSEIEDLLRSYVEQGKLKIQHILNEFGGESSAKKLSQKKENTSTAGKRGRPAGLPGTNIYNVKRVIEEHGPVSSKKIFEQVVSMMNVQQAQGCINALITKRAIKSIEGKYVIV